MTSRCTSETMKLSPSLVHEFANEAVTVCGVACAGSDSVPTLKGIVSVPEAGAVGASANVVAVPSTFTTSALPNEPVHDAGICTVIDPVIMSSSLATCVHVLALSG